MVDAITSSAAAVQTAAQQDQASLSSDFDQFLVLLTTQLQNQDPLSPMDSTEFTNQLVAFSGVEQQIKTNEQLASIVSSSQAAQTDLGLSYIGLQVSTESNLFKYVEDSTIKMSYELEKDASAGTVAIQNMDGETVYSFEMDQLSAGKHQFEWDGKDADGNSFPSGLYTVSAGALDSTQKSFTAQTTVPGYVEGIETADNGEVLLLINEQLIPMTDISRARL